MKAEELKKEIEGRFTLIWIEDFDEETKEFWISNPKKLKDMTFDKALGSLEWTKQSLGSKYPCFIYDPSKLSLWNEDGSQNLELIRSLLNGKK